MVATPASVSAFTKDGVSVVKAQASNKILDPNSVDATGSTDKVYSGAGEIETFFDSAADAYAVMTKRASILFQIGRLHEMVGLSETLGLGQLVPLAPTLPRFNVTDDSRSIQTVGVARSFAFDFSTDSYALEIVGTEGIAFPPDNKWSSTTLTFDDATPPPSFDRTLP